MKRYKDIDDQAKNASPELQMLLGELTLGRNLVELKLNGLKADINISTVPVVVDGGIEFRTVIFEKTATKQDERDILAEVAMGKLYSDKCIVIGEDSVFQSLSGKGGGKADSDDE